jgi:hypothetical protein
MSEGHSLARGHGEGELRTKKNGKQRARGTHSLESASGWTSQDMERKRASEGHSLPGERIGMD